MNFMMFFIGFSDLFNNNPAPLYTLVSCRADGFLQHEHKSNIYLTVYQSLLSVEGIVSTVPQLELLKLK